MKIEEQVCSLQLSKKLKELGIKQESLYFHFSCRNESSPKEQWNNINETIIRRGERKKFKERYYLKDQLYFSAFTVAELGEMLPFEFIHNEKYKFICYKFKESYGVDYIDSDKYCFSFVDSESKKEADARAIMLIYLVEGKHISIDTVNGVLK